MMQIYENNFITIIFLLFFYCFHCFFIVIYNRNAQKRNFPLLHDFGQLVALIHGHGVGFLMPGVISSAPGSDGTPFQVPT